MARKERGRFITIEGLDGCGKSTQLAMLATALGQEGVNVTVTREPGGTPLGEQIRAVLLDSRTAGLSPWAELALMFAVRTQHVREFIEPSPELGNWVLCDRFTDSSEAYQGGGRQLGTAPVLSLHATLCDGLMPDLTILMDSEIRKTVARARRRNRIRFANEGGLSEADESRFEQESRAFFGRVHNAYLEIARREPERVRIVDARRPVDVVHSEILSVVRSRFLPQAVLNLAL
jgi:dTMP kinase